MSFFKNKNVLVAGGTGLVGTKLTEELVNEGAGMRIASMDDPSRVYPGTEFFRKDMRIYENCREACQGMDLVFNLLGVKGSPAVVQKYPERFYYNMVMLNINLMEAACQNRVEGFLYTSSNGVYTPAEIMYEEDMKIWGTPPSPHDEFAGGAKRMGELQARACQMEYGIPVTVVRPSNIYGPYDNFDSENAMVIPSLIKKAVIAAETGQPLEVWGDGTPERDFIYSGDVAKAMLLVMEKAPGQTINISNGHGTSIKTLAETVVRVICQLLKKEVAIKYNPSGPAGDNKRILDNTRLRHLGLHPVLSLEGGLEKTVTWYLRNRSKSKNRFDVFDQK